MSGAPFQVERPLQTFPTLTPQQIARIERLGTRLKVKRGELLFDQGSEGVSFYVVLSGALEVVRPIKNREDPIVVHGPGQFTGEITLLTGRRSLARGRMIEDGEVIELSGEVLRTLVQTDSELSELLMRAFILRRITLIAQGWGDVLLLGSHHSSSTLRLKELQFERNSHCCNQTRRKTIFFSTSL